MLSGAGDIFIRTTGLSGGATAQRMIPLYLSQFEFTQETTDKVAKGFVGGKLVTKSTGEGDTTSTLKLTTEYVDWQQLGFALNQFPRVFTSKSLIGMKTATVPAAAPYEIVDAAITAGNNNDLSVSIAEAGTWGQPKTLSRATTPATPAAGEVGVDTTNTKFVFNAAQAGAVVTYTVPQVLSTVEGYGGSGTLSKIGNIEFRGKVYSPTAQRGFPIWFPNLQRKGTPTISISNDVPKLEISYGAIAPAGWDEPYEYLNLNTAP